MLETAHNHGLLCQKMRTDTSFLTANMSHSAYAESKTMETFHPRMSKVAHGRVLVSQNGAESYRGQSFFRGQSFVLIVVVSRRRQSFFVDGVYILWWLCTRIYWDIRLGKTAVNVWTNVQGVGRTRVGGHETRPQPKPNVDYYLVTYYYYYYYYHYY